MWSFAEYIFDIGVVSRFLNFTVVLEDLLAIFVL
jgi:hypothetical protein